MKRKPAANPLASFLASHLVVVHVGDKPAAKEETRDEEFNRLYNVPLATLQGMRAISQGQTDNLVIESPRFRVWVSRMTQDDYNGDTDAYVAERRTYEERIDGEWVALNRYGKRAR